jgi:hypothetical protein
MLFYLLVLLMVSMVVPVAPRFTYGHECPLESMARLQTFRALDQNQDRRLDLKEFMAQEWCRDAPDCQCQDAARRFFHHLDQNRDGFVTLEEHQALAREQQRRSR